MRGETPLWERVWIGKWSKVYVNAGKIIGSYGGRIIQLGLRFTF